MRHHAHVAILLLVVVISLLPLLVSCTSEKDNSEKLALFASVQEELVDSESAAHRSELVTARQDEISMLNTQLRLMSDDIGQLSVIFRNEQPPELPGPADRISDDQLRVFPNYVQLTIPDVTWSYLLDSNSMDPLLDEGTTILLVRPLSPANIQVGDIIVFNASYSPYNVVHRVHSIDKDEQGVYYVTKGDNNPRPDSERVRFSNITAVVIGVLY